MYMMLINLIIHEKSFENLPVRGRKKNSIFILERQTLMEYFGFDISIVLQ